MNESAMNDRKRQRHFPSSNMSSQSVDQDDSVHSCTDCGWQTDSDDEHPGTDRTKQAIQHHIETAHTVVHASSNRQTDYSRFWLVEGRL